jgi:hypothetical protein
MVFQNNVIAGAGGSTTPVYNVDQSIRFPWASTTSGGYMNKTYSGAGDRTSWTWSCWFKLGGLNGFTPASNYYYALFSCDSSTSDAGRGTLLIIADSGVESAIKFQFQGHSTIFLKTNRQFRDPSAWMHLVLVWDSDNAVATERARLYINGQRETSFTTQNNPTSGQEIGINLAAEHRIGGTKNLSSSALNYPWDGYMAEIHFLDGYSYGPEYFGETNSSGLWIPKEYDGSYGSNGFKIDGRDSADLGDDESGNGNDYSVSGLAAHDQVFDTPTNSFCVLNPISKLSYDSGVTVRGVSGVNLSSISKPSGNTNGFAFGTMGVTSGKWYYELYTTTYPAVEALGLGWIDAENAQTATSSGSGWRDFGVNQRHTTSAYSVWQWGLNESTNTGLTPFQASVVVGVATDFDNNTFTLTTNGSAYGSVDFDSTSPTQDLTDGTVWLPKSELANDAVALVTFNFGQDSTFNGQITAGGNADGNGVGNFKYSVPSGYLALCTKNLGS